MINRLTKLILIFLIFNTGFVYGTRFIIGNILRIIFKIFDIHNPPIIGMISTLTYNYTSQFLLLFIILYLLKKFDYMKYVKISLKAFLKLIVFTILLVGITKCLLDIFHIYNFTIWTGIEEKSLYWVSWVDYVGAILFIFLFVFVALTEEYLFRVIIYHKVSEIISLKNKVLHAIIAVLLTNILFAMGHWPSHGYKLLPYLYLTLWGIYFSYLYLRTKNIYTACVMHFILNAGIIVTWPLKNLSLILNAGEIFYIIVSIFLIEAYKIFKYFNRNNKTLNKLSERNIETGENQTFYEINKNEFWKRMF
ncbi:Abortive infection protein [Thermoanaerobacter ethanolicus JW 200]|nr:Abortive infection protein [Thermoanaerobacter ethanolicus JW 200]